MDLGGFIARGFEFTNFYLLGLVILIYLLVMFIYRNYYILVSSDDGNTSLTIDNNYDKFELFNINVPLTNKLQCKRDKDSIENEIPLNLYHDSDNELLLNFQIPLMLFKPDDFINENYSVLCYTNYGFFGIYPVNLMDLSDVSDFDELECQKGKLPCVFDVKINNVVLPPKKNIILNIHLVNEKHQAKDVCVKFKEPNNDELVYNIDYLSAPVYMVLDNFNVSVN